MTRSMAGPAPDVSLADPGPANPWNALWAMMVGFFMILVEFDSTRAVAHPSIMDALGIYRTTTRGSGVTSSYLLAFAVPLLLAGRRGPVRDPKNLYLGGLAIFTVSSLWCGLAGSVDMRMHRAGRAGSGCGAADPQTLSTIMRIFPA